MVTRPASDDEEQAAAVRPITSQIDNGEFQVITRDTLACRSRKKKSGSFKFVFLQPR